MRILVFLLIFLPLLTSWQVQETGLSSINEGQYFPKKAAETASNIIFQSMDGGQTWQDVSAGLPMGFQPYCVFAEGGEVFLGAENGLYRSSTSLVAPTPQWSQDMLFGEKISNVFPGRAGTYASSYGNGFFQYMPSTGLWISKHGALKDKRVVSILETPEGVLFAGCHSGIYKSTDDGKSWRHVFVEGMVSSLTLADGLLIAGGFKGVLRSTDGGEHWDWVFTDDGAATRTGLVKGGIGAITYDGSIQRVRVSTDQGKTWFLNIPFTPVIFTSDIKQAGEYLFCSNENGISRSSDKGKTWRLILPSKERGNYILSVSENTVFAVLMTGC